jgi:hypothetical protein
VRACPRGDVFYAQVTPSHIFPVAKIDRSSVRAGRILATLTSSGQGPQNSPYAFLLAAPGEGEPLSVIPLNAAGEGYTQGFGLRWDPAEGDYRLSGAVQGDPPAPTTGQISGALGYPSAGGLPSAPTTASSSAMCPRAAVSRGCM